MKIIIEYLIDWKTVIHDKKVLEDSKLSFTTFQNEFSFSNFWDVFGDFKTLIWDNSNSDNSLLFRGNAKGDVEREKLKYVDSKTVKPSAFQSPA